MNVIIPRIKANRKENFNTLIEIIISLTRFNDGGAAMLAEISKNHIIVIVGCVREMFLFNKIFRDLVLL